MNTRDILYFEILRGIDNYLRTSALKGTPMLAGYTGDKMCEKAAEELQRILPAYIEAQKNAIITMLKED